MFLFILSGFDCVVQGSADPLNSAFHLTYNMVLNLLRVEEINPEYMLEKSFYQFQHYRALPGVVESKHVSIFTTAHSRPISVYAISRMYFRLLPRRKSCQR